MIFKEYRDLKRIEKEELKKFTQRVPYDEDDNVVLQLWDNEMKKSFYIDANDDSISLTSDFKNYLLTFRDSFAAENISVKLDPKSSVQSKQKFEKLYQSFFKFNILKLAKELKANLRNILICFFAGLLVITMIVLIETLAHDDLKFISIIFEILAWVFIWEAFDMLFFKRPKMRTDQLKNYHMYRAKFVNDKTTVNVREISYKEKSKLNK